jgi:hypothetical protein
MDTVIGLRRARAGVDLDDLAAAAARYLAARWDRDDWRAARRGLSPRQHELILELADELAREWTDPHLGDTPADTRAYARELRRAIPRAVQALARR